MGDTSLALVIWFVLIAVLVGLGFWIMGEPLSKVILIAPLAGLGGLFALIWIKKSGY